MGLLTAGGVFLDSIESKAMFQDLKVVELASVLAGPAVGQFFAELGAQVIKVENPSGGDVTRSWKSSGEKTDDRSAYFTSVNWGKKSIALDLTTEVGNKTVMELIAEADVVIASYKKGDAEKLGVDWHQLHSKFPRLIYGSISGYGPESDRVGYDAVLQAETGFMSMNGEPGSNPLKMPVALIDVLAAHHLKEGLLLAIIKRMQTGQGSLVEVSLFHAAVASLVNQAANWLVGGVVPKQSGSAHPNIAPYGESFVTRDGKHVLLAVGTDRQFYDLCQVLDIETKLGDGFQTNHERVRKRSSLHEILSQRISTLDSDSFVPDLHRLKVPCGIIQNVKEVFSSPLTEPLMLEADGMRGVRSFVAVIDGKLSGHKVSAPPSLKTS